MIARMQASSTIIKELNENGYSNFFDEQDVLDIIDDLDNSLENIISRKKSYNRDKMLEKIRPLVTKGITSNLRNESISDMTEFVLIKLERYITSGFTQSYKTIREEKYFSYCSSQFEPSREFHEISNCALIHLRDKAKKTSTFDHLLINFGIDHIISKEISQFARNLILDSTGEDKIITIGGQIKLHPPKIVDTDSVNWHYDGDPRFIKILCFLEDQPMADGSFSIRKNFENDMYLGSHVKTIIQSINIKEALKKMPDIKIKELGIFLLNSHMPMLNRRYIDRARVDTTKGRQDTYIPAKFKLVMFKGVECLHKGGDNRQYCRPVYQGIASCTH